MKRSITEVRWEAKAGTESKVTGKKYWYSRLREPRQKYASGRENANKRLATRFYKLKTGHHWPIPRVDEEAIRL